MIRDPAHLTLPRSGQSEHTDARSIVGGRKHLEETVRTIIRTLTLSTLLAGTTAALGAQGAAPRRPVPPAAARVRAGQLEAHRELAADRVGPRRIMVARRNAIAARIGMWAAFRPGMRPGMRGGGRLRPRARIRMAERVGERRGAARERLANLTPAQRIALRSQRDAMRTERRRIGARRLVP